MRLIDADKLIISAENTFARPNGFIQLIEETETAYDVEKVLAELEEKKKALHALRGLEDDYYMGKECGYRDTIDIVRKGGVE